MVRSLGLALRQALEGFGDAHLGLEADGHSTSCSASSSTCAVPGSKALRLSGATVVPWRRVHPSAGADFMRIRTAFPDDMQDPDPENNVDDDAEDDHDQQVMDDSLFPNADEGDEGKRDLPTTTEEIEDTDGAMGSAEAAAAQLAKTSDEMRLGAVAAAGGLPKVMQDKVENFNSMAKLAAAMPVGAPLVNQ
eukprot:1311650-Amphidinium_carterae.1